MESDQADPYAIRERQTAEEGLSDPYACPDPYEAREPTLAEMLSIDECNLRKGDG